jgi:serine/threonine protein kinase
MLVEVARGVKNLVQWRRASSFIRCEECYVLTDAKEQAGSEPSGTRPVEVSEATGNEFGSGPKPSSFADTQPGTDYRGTAIPTGALLAGRYRIDHFIARGGMGEVYVAHDCVLNERIALKTVTGTSSGDMGSLAALRAEVTLSRKISHSNVCRMHDIGVHVSQAAPQLTFLTMEYIDGESLGARVTREGAIPEAEAARMLAAILMGLQAAHEAGVLHRDLKSDNVMLRLRANAEAVPVIMDFGLASVLSPNSSRVSSEQAMVGSLAYMAPEQVQGDALRVATDIYSVGVIFFEMLTGQLPFKASSPALAALKRLHEPAPRVRSIDPRLSPTLDRILAKALQHRPQDRYQSARAMLRDVREYLERGEQAEMSDRVSGGDFGADSNPEPSTQSAPFPDFGDEETTLVTGRSHRSAPRTARSEPPASLDNSLPVLAATAPPTGAQRPRRIATWLMVGGAAAGLVLLTLALPFMRRGDETTTAATPVTIGIGVQNVQAPQPGVGLRPTVNSYVSPELPTEVTSPVAAVATSRTAAISTASPLTAPLVAASPNVAAPPNVAALPNVAAPPNVSTIVSPKGPSTTKAPSLSRPPASSTAPAATPNSPAPAAAAPSASATSNGLATPNGSAGLIYPPGIKKPALLRSSDSPGVQ